MRDSDEEQIRIDLAATFRIIAHLGMHEAVANHFSAALSADGKTFLLNPKWKHFSRIRASDLLVLHADDERCAARPDVDATAWAIHGQIHQRLPDVRVVLHLHPVYTTSLACLATPQILPIDQNTARYFNRVAVDTLYGGMADTAAEGARLAGLLADNRRLPAHCPKRRMRTTPSSMSRTSRSPLCNSNCGRTFSFNTFSTFSLMAHMLLSDFP